MFIGLFLVYSWKQFNELKHNRRMMRLATAYAEMEDSIIFQGTVPGQISGSEISQDNYNTMLEVARCDWANPSSYSVTYGAPKKKGVDRYVI